MDIKKIACCTNFSENSERAFRTAFDMSKEHGAKLTIIHVLSPAATPLFTNQTYWVLPSMPNKSLILDIEERMQNEYGAKIGNSIDYDITVRNGQISSEVLKIIEEDNIELIVLGSYGYNGLGLVFFGSAIKKISRKANCPVLIVKGRERIDRRLSLDRRQNDIPLAFSSEQRQFTNRRSSNTRRIPVSTY